MTRPHDTTRMARYVEGRLNFFRITLEGTSLQKVSVEFSGLTKMVPSLTVRYMV